MSGADAASAQPLPQQLLRKYIAYARAHATPVLTDEAKEALQVGGRAGGRGEADGRWGWGAGAVGMGWRGSLGGGDEMVAMRAGAAGSAAGCGLLGAEGLGRRAIEGGGER
jgi:hypothetical protein